MPIPPDTFIDDRAHAAALSDPDHLAVQELVCAQILATGAYSAQDSRVLAQWTAAFYATYAERCATTARALYARYPLKVVPRAARSSGAQTGTLDQMAWHGSPHEGIRRFSTAHIGTGEGAQSFGWGIYFTDRRELADHYRKKLAQARSYDPNYWDSIQLPPDLTASEYRELLALRTKLHANAAEGGPPLTRVESARWRALRDREAVRVAAMEAARPKGQIYEVDIPEDGDLLLWDKTLGEHPPSVRRVLQCLAADIGNEHFPHEPDWQAMSGEQAYRRLAQDAGGPEGASRRLLAAGLKGIKYLDGPSRAAGQGSHNYVIFDGDDVRMGPTLSQGTRGSFRPADRAIALHAPADHSTWIHEAGHFFLEVLADLASQPDAPYPIVQDMEEVLQWMGVQPHGPGSGTEAGEPANDLKVVSGQPVDGPHMPSRGESVAEATILGPLGALNADPDYAAGKAGDFEAAMRTAERILTQQIIDQVLQLDAPIVVGALSIEASGCNQVPFAVAARLAHAARAVGAQLDTEIVQASAPKRTAMDGLERIFTRPIFDGQVQPGRQYVLVDDTITQGGTFAALAEHVEASGGCVAAMVALSGKHYSARLAPDAATVYLVREKFGDLEDAFRAATGYGFNHLTQSEARYLANFEPAADVRDRILARAGQGQRREGQEDPGRLSQACPADAPAFRAWFGRSIAVDDAGRPLVLHHASTRPITQFRPKDYGSAGLHGYFYFAASKAWARKFAQDELGVKPFMHQVHLSVRRALDLRGKLMNGPGWVHYLSSLGVQVRGVLRRKLDALPLRQEIAPWQLLRMDTPHTGAVREQLIAAGYDGLIMSDVVRGRMDNTTYVCFHPEQIRFAIGNGRRPTMAGPPHPMRPRLRQHAAQARGCRPGSP